MSQIVTHVSNRDTCLKSQHMLQYVAVCPSHAQCIGQETYKRLATLGKKRMKFSLHTCGAYKKRPIKDVLLWKQIYKKTCVYENQRIIYACSTRHLLDLVARKMANLHQLLCTTRTHIIHVVFPCCFSLLKIEKATCIIRCFSLSSTRKSNVYNIFNKEKQEDWQWTQGSHQQVEITHDTLWWHTATHCNTLQHTAIHCNTLPRSTSWNRSRHTLTTHCNTCNTLQHTATHCTTLQHTATHCNTLQHTATTHFWHKEGVCVCVWCVCEEKIANLPCVHCDLSLCVLMCACASVCVRACARVWACAVCVRAHRGLFLQCAHWSLFKDRFRDIQKTGLTHKSMHCNTLRHTLQHTATHSATHCDTLCDALRHTLQHTATDSAVYVCVYVHT